MIGGEALYTVTVHNKNDADFRLTIMKHFR